MRVSRMVRLEVVFGFCLTLSQGQIDDGSDSQDNFLCLRDILG